MLNTEVQAIIYIFKRPIVVYQCYCRDLVSLLMVTVGQFHIFLLTAMR